MASIQRNTVDPNVLQSNGNIDSIDLRAEGTQYKESPQLENKAIEAKVQDLHTIDNDELKMEFYQYLK